MIAGRAKRGLVSLVVSYALVLVAAGCNGGNGNTSPTLTAAQPPVPSAMGTAVPTATATISVEQSVTAAYANYWKVYADALFNLDSTHLAEVMTGPRLERGLEEVRSLRERGRAAKIVVRSQPILVQVEGDRAVLLDEYQNLSYLIDPVTKETIGQTPTAGETIRDSVTLTRVAGTWKVLDTLREQGR